MIEEENKIKAFKALDINLKKLYLKKLYIIKQRRLFKAFFFFK